MKNQPNLFSQELQPPKSHIEEVLFCLITKGSASIVDFRYMPGFILTEAYNFKVNHIID